MDELTQLKIESATLKRLLHHLETHTTVQNIDLMITADFCRNCLAKWYVASADEQGLRIDYEKAREIIYGMPYHEWKEKYQTQATPEQLLAFENKKNSTL